MQRPSGEGAQAWICGFLGVVTFAGSLPATRLAVGAFDPVFLTCARAVIAGLIGGLMLIILKERRPAPSDLRALAIVAGGVVIGYPLLSGLALQHVTAAHSTVFLGLLPLSTATFGVLRGGERPKPAFWLFSVIGSLAVVAFAISRGGEASLIGDLLMIAGVVVCGLGYAEGAVLARRLGGWQVICWALVLALPLMGLVAFATRPLAWTGVGVPAWLGLAYVSLFSMLIGFVFWYRGLALGGIARIGQLQLLQPFMGLAAAAVVLHEPVALTMVAAAGVIVVCVAGARRFA